MMRVAGIDNGLDGGLALYDGSHVSVSAMPTVGKGKRDFDMGQIKTLLQTWLPDHVILERAQSMPKQGVASTFCTGRGAGLIEGLVIGLGLPYTVVSARTWQLWEFAGMPKLDTKAMSIQRALSLWPAIRFMANERCRIAHNGMTDAILMAHYGHSQMNGGKKDA